MKGAVTAHPLTVFGKRSPDRDYEWLGGRSEMPDRISTACEQVVRTSNETGALLALVAAVEEEIFLARTFGQGIDGAYRPILAIEVLRVDDELAPLDWPALALGALEERALETAGSGTPTSVELAASRVSTASRLDAETLDRIRLGLPVSVDTPEAARAILAEHSDRYLGVVYALRMRGGTPVPWRPELTPFIAIQWGQPVLSPEEADSLRLLEQRRPTAEEWNRLAGVAPEKVRRALRWALSPGAESPLLDSVDDPLVPWLVAFRRATAGAGELLVHLQRDLGGRPLDRPTLDDAFPDLSPAARAVLAQASGSLDHPDDTEEGAGEEIALPVLAELAGRGLLRQGSPIPPRRWLHRARDSQELAHTALELLRGRGIGEGWARMLLQLSPLPNRRPQPAEAERAVAIARELGLPPPLDEWRKSLAGVRSPEELETAIAFGRALGGANRALADLAGTGQLPDEEPEAGDFSLALGAYSRAVAPLDTLACAAELLQRGWPAALRAVLDAEEERDLPPLPPLAREVLRARIDGAPPPAVVSAAEIRPLVDRKVARPGDVIPGRPEEMAALADLWPETQSIAAVLSGTGNVPLRDACPEAWLPALRQGLSPERAEAWLSRLEAGKIPAARTWLCHVHELPPGVTGLFAPDPPPRIDGSTLRPALNWVAVLAGPADLEDRIEALSRLARSRALEGDDRRAAALVDDLLSDVEWEIKELAVHILSKVGPLPPLSTIQPEVVATLAPFIDPIGLVNALLSGPNTTPTRSPQLVEAVFLRVRQAGVTCPPQGYTAAQTARHGALADRLSGLAGWTALASAGRLPETTTETAGMTCTAGGHDGHE